MADDITVDVSFRGNAPDFLAELSRAVGKAKDQLRDMGQSTAALSRLEGQLARMSTTAGGAAAQMGKATQATKGWSQAWTPFKGQFLEAEKSSNQLWKSIDSGILTSEKSLGRASATIAKFEQERQAATQNMIQRQPFDEWDKAFAKATVEADKNTDAMRRAKQAIEQYNNSLSNTRYVLYDVAGTLSILGIGLVAPLAAIIGTAVKFEAAFAQVARTSGVTGSALENLKSDFNDLYGTIPITYDALAEIATLAGQLGVPASDIAEFTEVTAKMATVTDLSVEQAATAFGRLDALIPNVKGQYDRLGSAIAKVGVNSVATESDIVNIATQISSMGAFAGLTAQDIVGLSGALASIGAQPELSRGTITRVFTLMSKAVAAGGDDLERFAKLSGVSADQFKSSWGTPAFTKVFLGFMRGIKDEGGNAVQALNDLGITSVRDVPLLTRLANAADSTGKAGALLAQTIGDSNQGWAENIELQRQYAIVAATVQARFEVLTNNANLFLQAIGAPMLSGLGEFISFLTDVTKGMTEFAKTDFGGSVFGIVTVMGALVGVLAIAGGAMAIFGASSIGVYQALQGLAIQSPKTAAAILGTGTASAIASGEMKAAQTSAILLGRALKAITIVGALLLLPEILKVAGDAMDDFLQVNQEVSGQIKQLGDSSSNVFLGMIESVHGSRNAATDLINTLSGAGRAFMTLDDGMKSLVAEGNIKELQEQLRSIQKATGESGDEILSLFGEVVSKAKDAGIEIKVVNGEIEVTGKSGKKAKSGTDDFAESMAGVEDRTQAANDALDEYQTKLDEINGTVISQAETQDRLQESINAATKAIEESTKADAEHKITLEGTNDESIKFRDNLRDIEDRARAAGQAVLDNGGSTEQATAAWQKGRDEMIRLLGQLGLAPDKAQAMADAMYGTKDQMLQAFSLITGGLKAIPDETVTIYTYADTNGARRALNQVWADFNGKKLWINVGANVPGGPRPYATGGSVFGPGTATSDSIPALLSNGEYVVRTQAARAIGYGRLDHMNRTGQLPRFATGGQVGVPAQTTVAFPDSMMTELSPTDRGLLARGGTTDVRVSIADVARQVNAYNAKQTKRGR